MVFGQGGSEYTLATRITSSGFGSLTSNIGGATSALGKFKTAAAGTAAVVGGALVAGFGQAVRSAAKFEQSLVELEKVAGAETAQQMTSEIKNMAETIPLGVNALADITAQAARFGVRGTENLRSFSESVSKMAVATDLSADRAGKALAKLAELTDTPISSIENLGSSVNELSNNFATSSSEIVDSMLRSSAALSQIGLEQTEIAGLSAALNEVSSSSRRAGSRMRRLAQEMMDPGKVGDLASAFGKTKDQFRAMVKRDPTGTIIKMAEAMKKGGKRANLLRSTLSTTSRQAVAGLSQNLEGVSQALDTSATAFEENTSLQSEFEAATDTFNAQLQLLENRLRNAAITVGSALLPALTNLLKRIQPLIDRFSEFVKGLSNTQIQAAALGSVVLTVTGTLGYFYPALLSVSGAVGALGTAVGTLGTAFTVLTGPVGVAVAAITTLGYVVSQNFGQIKAIVGSVLTAVGEELRATHAALVELGGAVKWALQPAVSAFNSFEQSVNQTTGSILADLTGPLVGGIRAAGDAIRSVIFGLTAFIGNRGTEIRGILRRTGQGIRSIIGQALGDLQSDTRGALSGIEGLWMQHGGGVRTTVRDTFSYVKQHPIQSLNLLATRVGGPLGVIVSAVRHNLDLIESEFTLTFASIQQSVQTYIQTIRRQIIHPLSNAESRTRGTLSSIQSEFQQTFGLLLTETRQTWQMISDIVSRVTAVILRNVGPFLRDMLAIWREHFSGANGLVANTRSALNTIWTVVKPFLDLLQRVFKTTLDAIQAGWSIFGDDLIRILDGALGTISTIVEISFDALLTTINVFLDLISGDFRGAWNTIEGFLKRTWTRITEWFGGSGKKLIVGAIGLIVDAVKAVFRGLTNWLIGNSWVQETIGSVASWLTGRGKRKVKGAFDSVVNGIESALDNISLSGIKSSIDGVISKANDAISSIQNIPSDVSTTVNQTVNTVTGRDSTSTSSSTGRHVGAVSTDSGGSDVVPWLQGFQHGGIARRPVAGLVAESGPEAVAPLDELPGILAEAAKEAGNGTGGSRGDTVVTFEEGAIQVEAEDGDAAGKKIANHLRSVNFHK